MKLEIITPSDKVYQSDDVFGIQLPGENGLFEVLHNHAPIISSLKKGKLKILLDKNNKTEVYNIEKGFLEVLNNKATVLVDSAEPES